MANGDSMMMLLNGMHWDMPVTENPVIDSTEIWELVNTTEDSHPIHLHLVRFQLLDRRSFNEPLFFRTRQFRYVSAPEPPEPWETGWKDTVRAHSKMVTRIIVRFEGYHRSLRLALPRAGARRQRNDAALRSYCNLTGVRKEIVTLFSSPCNFARAIFSSLYPGESIETPDSEGVHRGLPAGCHPTDRRQFSRPGNHNANSARGRDFRRKQLVRSLFRHLPDGAESARRTCVQRRAGDTTTSTD